MKTNSISCQSFGLKIVAPSCIGQKHIKQFLETPLVKEIDKKYPQAITKISIYKINDMVNDEPTATLVARTMLEKGKIWDFAIDSHGEVRAFESLLVYARTASLEDVEKDLSDEVKDFTPKIEIKIKSKKESFLNKLKSFFSLK